ncbi:hypothetical protein DFP72DRAFT_54187 [Ephemerocybe angulata]|uniref:Uncharacterized protein n=1 Tax=Ephemerocybe angulata TaxID=980116 RepID=A0A8H6HEY9_9AGAR|nr:hypothetical protein DFP72DRAFT_54187 [Tulosesus angulatus]
MIPLAVLGFGEVVRESAGSDVRFRDSPRPLFLLGWLLAVLLPMYLRRGLGLVIRRRTPLEGSIVLKSGFRKLENTHHVPYTVRPEQVDSNLRGMTIDLPRPPPSAPPGATSSSTPRDTPTRTTITLNHSRRNCAFLPHLPLLKPRGPPRTASIRCKSGEGVQVVVSLQRLREWKSMTQDLGSQYSCSCTARW